jgi:hypothetical protein
MYALKLLFGAVAISGGAFAAQVVEETSPDTYIADAAYVEDINHVAAEDCFIDVETIDDGVVLSAWSHGSAGSAYRMVVTQSYGGGGFDLVQEGEIPLVEGAPVLLSDMWLDVEASFTARLSTWSAEGELVCSWGDQV